MKFIIVGRGKMGRLLQERATAQNDTVVATFDKDDLSNLENFNEPVDLLLDFSNPTALTSVASYIKRTGTALLSGTTGYSESDMESLRKLGNYAPVLWSANYSLGVAVLFRALQLVAPVLSADFDIEITETHHNQKIDAPSGTAKLLLSAVDPKGEQSHVYGRSGNCGARTKNEIGIHALRGGTVAGVHSVHFFGADEELEFTHRATSRIIFVNGALHAAHMLAGRKAGFYDLQKILFGE